MTARGSSIKNVLTAATQVVRHEPINLLPPTTRLLTTRPASAPTATSPALARHSENAKITPGSTQHAILAAMTWEPPAKPTTMTLS